MIEEDRSPGQIVGVLCKEGIRICKQTIYNHVHADPTGKLAKHMSHELKYTRRMKKQRLTGEAISRTVQAYMNGLQKQTGNVSGIGKWIRLRIHTAMRFLP